jgi:hypothetical protein
MPVLSGFLFVGLTGHAEEQWESTADFAVAAADAATGMKRPA